MTTISTILQGQYKTNSKNRLTSNEEFNRDAEYIGEIKQMYMKSMKRVRELGTGINDRRMKFAEMVFDYAKDESIKLKIKTWGK